MQKNKSKPELADIFRKYGADYRRSHFLSTEQSKTMYHIEICRTALLGGHTEACDHCGFKKNAYNSCRDRHCPKCQTLVKEKWLDARKSELLPCPYFHLHCIIPAGVLSFDKTQWIAARNKYLFRVQSLAIKFRKYIYKNLKKHTNKKTSIPLLRQLINPDKEFTAKLSETIQEIMLRVTGVDVTLYPECGQGTMVCVESLSVQGLDTS